MSCMCQLRNRQRLATLLPNGILRITVAAMGERETQFDHDVVAETEKKVEQPRLFKVILHNDDYTTMEFVVQVLQSVFHKPLEEATQIMLHVHQNGLGVCGIYTYEIAETKVAEVLSLAQAHEYPLQCSMEEA